MTAPADHAAVLRDFISAYDAESDNGKALRAALAALEGQQGVVAWRYMYSDSRDWLYQRERPNDPPDGNPDGKLMQPLYLAPPAAREVTERDVERACIAALAGFADCIPSAQDALRREIRAALESFANGGDGNG